MSKNGYEVLEQLELEPEVVRSKFAHLKKRKNWIIVIAAVVVFLLTTQSFLVHPPPQGPPGSDEDYEHHGPPPGTKHHHKPITFDNFDSKISPIEFLNASAIFNEVNNAVREKNSVLNPIGVSFIPAYIPEGTILYHATRNGNSIPDEPEWLAFDYEFSYNFAGLNRGNRRGPPGGPGHHNGTHPPWGPPAGPHGGPPGSDRPPPPPPPENSDHYHPPRPNSSRPFSGSSHMLSFQVDRPLDKLIYLPGASAAKTRTGEMDTQFILGSFESYDEFDERIAADKICKWGARFGLDGYIRLETGFELVVCDFNDKLKLVSDVKLSNATNLIGFPPEVFPDESERGENGNKGEFVQFADIENESDVRLEVRDDVPNSDYDDDLVAQRKLVLDKIESFAGFEQYQGGARVYHGENKVLLDFSRFETPLNRTFVSPDPYTRRIHNVSDEIKEGILNSLERSFQRPNNPYQSTDWRIITTNIESKFGPILLSLNATFNQFGIYDKEKLAKTLSKFTYNYIRRYIDETVGYELTPELKKMAIWDYAHPLQPIQSPSDYLIWSSVTIVQSSVIDTIYDVFKLSTKMLQAYYVTSTSDVEFDDEILEMQSKLVKLINELNWSVNYKCSQACGIDEICFLPTWGPSPLGWGGSSIGYEYDSFGIKRIAKDLVCLSPEKLYEAQHENRH